MRLNGRMPTVDVNGSSLRMFMNGGGFLPFCPSATSSWRISRRCRCYLHDIDRDPFDLNQSIRLSFPTWGARYAIIHPTSSSSRAWTSAHRCRKLHGSFSEEFRQRVPTIVARLAGINVQLGTPGTAQHRGEVAAVRCATWIHDEESLGDGDGREQDCDAVGQPKLLRRVDVDILKDNGRNVCPRHFLLGDIGTDDANISSEKRNINGPVTDRSCSGLIKLIV